MQLDGQEHPAKCRYGNAAPAKWARTGRPLGAIGVWIRQAIPRLKVERANKR